MRIVAGIVVVEVHAVAGDGRCLFRSVVGARSLRDRGDERASRKDQRGGALRSWRWRNSRRMEETEWFIEGDFEQYCRRMNAVHVGGTG